MSKIATLFAALLSLGLPQGPAEAGQEPVKPTKPRHAVVVHASNKTTATGDAAKAIVKKLFLKDLSQWPDGSDAKVYARESTSPEQAAFRQDVLGMTEAELARHWLKLKSMNGTTPPKEVETDRMVLKYVAKNPSALGVVSVDAIKGRDDVRVLFEF